MKSRRELLAGAAGLGAGLLVVTASKAQTLLTATASPSIVSGTGSTISDPVYAVASGGTPPYTYQWVKTSGSPYIEARSPDSATTDFQWIGPLSGPARLAAFHCVVTDASNATAISDTVRAAFDPTL